MYLFINNTIQCGNEKHLSKTHTNSLFKVLKHECAMINPAFTNISSTELFVWNMTWNVK